MNCSVVQDEFKGEREDSSLFKGMIDTNGFMGNPGRDDRLSAMTFSTIKRGEDFVFWKNKRGEDFFPQK